MIKNYIIIWNYHDTNVEYFEKIDEARKKYFKICQEHRNCYSDFKITVFKLKGEVEFV